MPLNKFSVLLLQKKKNINKYTTSPQTDSKVNLLNKIAKRCNKIKIFF